MTSTLLTWIDGALSRPARLFNAVSPNLGLAAMWVTVISLLQPLSQPQDGLSMLLSALFSLAAGWLSWLGLGLIVHAAAYVFGGHRAGWDRFLTLSALALTPWLAMPSLALLRHSDIPGLNSLATLISWGLWFWSFGLLCLAVSVAYNLSWKQVTLAVALVPATTLLAWAVLFNGVGHLITVLR